MQYNINLVFEPRKLLNLIVMDVEEMIEHRKQVDSYYNI